ncbi:MAG TPA: HAMP domain-containing protein [Candidatus Binatia bacterium]|jgi:HAMP domain-containing protein|nr:HAMP domain-containing protein [Candidatus Binatia bacterium]
MRNRILGFALLVSLGCVFLGLVLSNSRTDNSVTLADLASQHSRVGGANETVKQLAQSWLPNLGVDLIFYVVLAACGILLAFRAIVSAVRISRAERLLRSRDHAGYNLINEAEARPMEVKPLRATQFGSTPETAADSPSIARRSHLAHLLPTRAWSRVLSYGHGLTGKMIFTFTAIIAAFGALTLALVYFTLKSSLTKQWIQRARVTAVNVSDGAPSHLFKKDAIRLREFLRTYANRPGMAYVLIEDRQGEILSHSFAVLPQQVQNTVPIDRPQTERQSLFRLGDGMVYEVRVPILEGQMGAVRVGIWKNDVDAEISKTVVPIVKLVVLVVCGGILLAIFLVWRITRPIVRLVRTARRISEGELDIPSLGVNDAGEFGELSRSFERMRSSVKAAIVRLNEDR